MNFVLAAPFRKLAYLAFVVSVVLTLSADLPGLRLQVTQGCNLGRQQAVGGIAISPSGELKLASPQEARELRQALVDAVANADSRQNQDLRKPTELRKVSLRRLQAAIAERLAAGQPLTDEIDCLAGLQNIRHVFVYPEQQDIVLAGYAEGWKVDEHGYVIGQTTGRPVILLDDWIVALRAMKELNGKPITCSIDPTAAGLERLQSFVKTLSTAGNNRRALESAIESKLGTQTVTVTGVPDTSHFARVLVAADYRMKRIAMALDKSPVAGLPSYLSMLSGGGRGVNNMLPRWWITANYGPLQHDEEKLAWSVTSKGAKTMSEEDLLQADGTLQRGAQHGGLVQRWADLMTHKYDELALRDPIFGQLQSLMDLSVAASLIVGEGLEQRAGLDLRKLLNDFPLTTFVAATRVPTVAQSMNKGTSVVISASGGVEIQPLAVLDTQEVSVSVGPLRQQATAPAGDRWWWN